MEIKNILCYDINGVGDVLLAANEEKDTGI